MNLKISIKAVTKRSGPRAFPKKEKSSQRIKSQSTILEGTFLHFKLEIGIELLVLIGICQKCLPESKGMLGQTFQPLDNGPEAHMYHPSHMLVPGHRLLLLLRPVKKTRLPRSAFCTHLRHRSSFWKSIPCLLLIGLSKTTLLNNDFQSQAKFS